MSDRDIRSLLVAVRVYPDLQRVFRAQESWRPGSIFVLDGIGGHP
jgi:hypothetical protein